MENNLIPKKRLSAEITERRRIKSIFTDQGKHLIDCLSRHWGKFILIMGFVVMNALVSADEKEKTKRILDFERIYTTLEVKDTENKTLKLSGIKSGIVLINFWASWCGPCLEEMPSLIKLREKYDSTKLTIIAINTDQENQLGQIKKVKTKYKIPDSVFIVPDKNFELADTFKFSSVPVSIFFKNGKVIQFNDDSMDFIKDVPADLKL